MTKTESQYLMKATEAVSIDETAFLLNVINPLIIQTLMTNLMLGMNRNQANPSQIYLNSLLQPVFRGTRTEGKRDAYPWQSVGELCESEIDSFNFRVQPVFRGTRTEGKRDAYDV